MEQVPNGWEFYTADFSLKAAGNSSMGGVMLVRDQAGKKLWHSLPPEVQEKVALYVSGAGPTLFKAVEDAVQRALVSGFGHIKMYVDTQADGSFYAGAVEIPGGIMITDPGNVVEDLK